MKFDKNVPQVNTYRLTESDFQSAVMRLHVVCPSVRPSVTFRYRDQIGWNSSKIISRPNSGPCVR